MRDCRKSPDGLFPTKGNVRAIFSEFCEIQRKLPCCHPARAVVVAEVAIPHLRAGAKAQSQTSLRLSPPGSGPAGAPLARLCDKRAFFRRTCRRKKARIRDFMVIERSPPRRAGEGIFVHFHSVPPWSGSPGAGSGGEISGAAGGISSRAFFSAASSGCEDRRRSGSSRTKRLIYAPTRRIKKQ